MGTSYSAPDIYHRIRGGRGSSGFATNGAVTEEQSNLQSSINEQVTGLNTKANGNAIPVFFGGLLGRRFTITHQSHEITKPHDFDRSMCRALNRPLVECRQSRAAAALDAPVHLVPMQQRSAAPA